jgi:hypothetical protein
VETRVGGGYEERDGGGCFFLIRWRGNIGLLWGEGALVYVSFLSPFPKISERDGC